jgi:N-ethylmaleimide reductase
MATLFDPFDSHALHLKHRVVMAPLTRNRAGAGWVPMPLMAQYYAQRANPTTGASLIVSEATQISQQGQGYADTPGVYTPEQVAGWRRVTDAVHAQGGVIFCQLWHVGRVSHVSLQALGAAPVAPSALQAKTKTFLYDGDGPSRVGTFVDVSMPRALDAGELPGIVADYVHAARCAIEAGFDGVEIHSANGYLLDQFLRSSSNHRTDDFGGTVANRSRFPLQVLRAVGQAIGVQRLAIRISPVTPANDVSDDAPQALFEHYLRELGRHPDTQAMAYVHVIEGSTGGSRDHIQGPGPFDYAALKAAYREAGGQGAWMLNNGYTADLAQQQLDAGADLICFGKAFIANPDLTRRLRSGAPLNEPQRKTFYGGSAEGYTDYPALP